MIEREVITGPDSWRGHGGMAVSPSGVLAFATSGKEGDPRIALLDSGGRLIASFSRTGEGPGEVRTIGSLWFDGDTLGAFDLMAQRASRFDPKGAFLEARQIAGIGQPVGMTPGGIAVILLGSGEPEIAALSHYGDAVPLIDRSDAGYDSIVRAPSRSRPDGALSAIPALAVHGDMVAFADAWTDRIAWVRGGRTFARYGEGTSPRLPTDSEIATQRRSLEEWRGPDGKPMPPADIARRMADFAAQPVRAFDRRPGFGMSFDGRGRLWLPRELADSVAWDILTPGRLLGTVTLPCAGGSNRGRSVNGGFLAMECEAQTDTLPVVRVWRIEG